MTGDLMETGAVVTVCLAAFRLVEGLLARKRDGNGNGPQQVCSFSVVDRERLQSVSHIISRDHWHEELRDLKQAVQRVEERLMSPEFYRPNCPFRRGEQ